MPRTVTFKSVVDDIVDRKGIDPLKRYGQKLARSITRYVNERVRTAWLIWDWPELSVTEERAFRSVWNNNRQFMRNNPATGKPDEFFYIPNTTYYRVRIDAPNDPPIGTEPIGVATETYFEVLQPVDTYVEYDQTCKRPIGWVLGVYGKNPRESSCCNGDLLPYSPSEFGVDIVRPTGPTVFIHYMQPVSRFSFVPWVVGGLYQKGDVRYDTTVGDCFLALANNNVITSNPDVWRRMPFPEVFASFVKDGAFSDLPIDSRLNEAQTAIAVANATRADAKAWEKLYSEMGNLGAQGLRHGYGYHYGCGGICSTQPWTGGSVQTLTDVCETDWIYPPLPETPSVRWLYRPDINSLRTSDNLPPPLDQVSTRLLLVGSLIELVITISGSRQRRTYQLGSHAADPGDPGHVQPVDYEGVTNSKHWERVT